MLSTHCVLLITGISLLVAGNTSLRNVLNTLSKDRTIFDRLTHACNFDARKFKAPRWLCGYTVIETAYNESIAKENIIIKLTGRSVN